MNHARGLLEGSGEEAARIAMTDDAVLALVRQHFAGADSISLCPSIPGKKELGAREAHARHLPTDERVLMLFDDTVFGSGDEGFLVTSQRLCWKNPSDRPRMIEWKQIDPDGMYADRRRLVLGTHSIAISGDESVTLACEQAFHVLAFSARAPSHSLAASSARSGIALTPADAQHPSKRPTVSPSHPAFDSMSPPLENEPRVSNATPPPSHFVTYDSYVTHAASQNGPAFACWCCSTPLYWNTPQCARCSALPKPQGWRSTGSA